MMQDLHTVIVPAQEIREASQRTGGRNLKSLAVSAWLRWWQTLCMNEKGQVLLVRHFLSQRIHIFPTSLASPTQDPTSVHDRTVLGFLNHCAPARVCLTTGHGILQLLEVDGWSLDKTHLDFKKYLFLGKESSMGHLLVLHACASQMRLSVSSF